PARARSVEADLEERWQPIAGEGTLRLDRTDGGLELRALGHDKGSAAASLIGACPSRTIAVFVGDDRSDEDAFEVVSSGGFGVRVGAHRASRATLRLEPERLSEFLDQWLRVAARAS
ncbi:MAG TPA: trehalose-phosphatase, partial [Candidatus Udaeobacter sp.]|nr:trehalose-phosphatase [Candidatus Udaeobacter sp.]